MTIARHAAFVAALILLSLGVPPAAAGEVGQEVESKLTLNISGQTRNYILKLPSGHTGGPLPLIIVLHGFSGSPQQIRGYFPFESLADREGFALAYPEGNDRQWNDVRFADQGLAQNVRAAADVEFLDALAGELIEKHVADPKRIYLTGVSNGGFMAMTMACFAPKRFAAVAVVAASAPMMDHQECKPDHVLPLLIMNGTSDPLLQWNAVQAHSQGYMGGEEFFAFWSALSGCSGLAEKDLADTDTTDKSTIRVISAKNCPAGRVAELYRIDGGGHHPPTRELRPASTFMGARNRDIEAAEEIWAFFKPISR